jgi:putative phosphoribosyl transferase
MWPPERERFEDRADAGRALGAAVAAHLGMIDGPVTPLVLALPRGGVPVGVEVAAATGGELDLVLVRKVGLPWQPDFGVGAIAEDCAPVFDHGALASYDLHPGDMAPAIARERAEMTRWNQMYRMGRPAPSITGRIVVIVDDGLASGIGARAAVRAVRAGNPSYLAFAAPVCAAESVDWLTEEADAVIDLYSPREFHALGLYYRHFPAVTDTEVRQMCVAAWQAAPVG